MINNRDVIIIGIQPWDIEIGCNCKNIAEIIALNNRVLYVNTPLDRKSKYTERETQKVKRRIRVLNGDEEPLQRISDNLWELNPRTLLESINFLPDGFAFDLLNRLNNRRLAREILWAANKLQFKDYYLFNDNNMILGFYQKEFLKPDFYIYYIRDFLIKNPYWRKHGLRLEPKLIRKADVVVNNSDMYADYARQFTPHSYMVGQGCEIDSYNEEIQPINIAEDLSGVPGPIIGYVGFLSARRLNLELMEQLASNRPDWSMVLVGPEDDAFKVSLLHHLPNVFFLGSRKPEELPGYIKGFDVCLNPQLINEATMGNYPRKIDEYLAMGKPTVASATKAMEYFGEFTYLGVTVEDYIRLIDRALIEDSKELADRRRVFAGTHSWENNVNEIYLSVDRVRKVREANTTLPLSSQTGLKAKIKANPRLQKWVMWFISPRRRPRPRWYIRLIFNRFVHKRGKHSLIRTPSRMDLFPYNKFELGEDSTIESFCVVNNGAGDVIIGSKAIIGIGSVVIGPVKMGKGSGLGQNVFVSGFNHGYKDGTRNSSEQPLDLRPVLIGEDSHIGANAVVLAGVKIGKRCQIGAGSVVTRDIPDFSIAVGNPARVIKRFNPVSGQWEMSDNLKHTL